jgi:hypothetical protein
MSILNASKNSTKYSDEVHKSSSVKALHILGRRSKSKLVIFYATLNSNSLLMHVM